MKLIDFLSQGIDISPLRTGSPVKREIWRINKSILENQTPFIISTQEEISRKSFLPNYAQ